MDGRLGTQSTQEITPELIQLRYNLLGIVLAALSGDALGAPLEFQCFALSKTINLDAMKMIEGAQKFCRQAGNYTDDGSQLLILLYVLSTTNIEKLCAGDKQEYESFTQRLIHGISRWFRYGDFSGLHIKGYNKSIGMGGTIINAEINSRTVKRSFSLPVLLGEDFTPQEENELAQLINEKYPQYADKKYYRFKEEEILEIMEILSNANKSTHVESLIRKFSIIHQAFEDQKQNAAYSCYLDNISMYLVEKPSRYNNNTAHTAVDMLCGNGSTMRLAGAVVAAKTIEQAMILAYLQSIVTTPSPEAACDAMLEAYVTFKTRNCNNKDKIFDFKDFKNKAETLILPTFESGYRVWGKISLHPKTENLCNNWEKMEVAKPGAYTGSYATEGLGIALRATKITTSLVQLLTYVACAKGDADSNAAVAGHFGGGLYGLNALLPEWIEALNRHRPHQRVEEENASIDKKITLFEMINQLTESLWPVFKDIRLSHFKHYSEILEKAKIEKIEGYVRIIFPENERKKLIEFMLDCEVNSCAINDYTFLAEADKGIIWQSEADYQKLCEKLPSLPSYEKLDISKETLPIEPLYKKIKTAYRTDKWIRLDFANKREAAQFAGYYVDPVPGFPMEYANWADNNRYAIFREINAIAMDDQSYCVYISPTNFDRLLQDEKLGLNKINIINKILPEPSNVSFEKTKTFGFAKFEDRNAALHFAYLHGPFNYDLGKLANGEVVDFDILQKEEKTIENKTIEITSVRVPLEFLASRKEAIQERKIKRIYNLNTTLKLLNGQIELAFANEHGAIQFCAEYGIPRKYQQENKITLPRDIYEENVFNNLCPKTHKLETYQYDNLKVQLNNYADLLQTASGILYVKFKNEKDAVNTILFLKLENTGFDAMRFPGYYTLSITKDVFEKQFSKHVKENVNDFKLDKESCKILRNHNSASLTFNSVDDAARFYSTYHSYTYTDEENKTKEKKYTSMKLDGLVVTLSEKDYKELRSRNTFLPKYIKLNEVPIEPKRKEPAEELPGAPNEGKDITPKKRANVGTLYSPAPKAALIATKNPVTSATWGETTQSWGISRFLGATIACRLLGIPEDKVKTDLPYVEAGATHLFVYFKSENLNGDPLIKLEALGEELNCPIAKTDKVTKFGKYDLCLSIPIEQVNSFVISTCGYDEIYATQLLMNSKILREIRNQITTNIDKLTIIFGGEEIDIRGKKYNVPKTISDIWTAINNNNVEGINTALEKAAPYKWTPSIWDSRKQEHNDFYKHLVKVKLDIFKVAEVEQTQTLTHK